MHFLLTIDIGQPIEFLRNQCHANVHIKKYLTLSLISENRAA